MKEVWQQSNKYHIGVKVDPKERPAESLAALDLSQFIPGRASLVTNAMDSLSIPGQFPRVHQGRPGPVPLTVS